MSESFLRRYFDASLPFVLAHFIEDYQLKTSEEFLKVDAKEAVLKCCCFFLLKFFKIFGI